MSGKEHLLIVMLAGSSVIRLTEHIDHSRAMVTYVTDRARAAVVMSGRDHVADVIVVDDPADLAAEVIPRIERLFRRLGTADAVFAPSEYDLLAAATIRDKFGIPGMTGAQTLCFRDKVRMKQRVSAAGLAVPRFSECGSLAEASDFADSVGYPLVLKPRRGMGSRGIHVVSDRRELTAAWPQINPAEYELEEFVTGTIYHVDGLVYGGRLAFGHVSRYLRTCLDTAHNRVPLGSVAVDDPVLGPALRDFAMSCLTALALQAGAFHLEIILNGAKPVFLEAGARVGGGQIRFVFQDLYGIDIMREWAGMELGRQPVAQATSGLFGGWLVVPPPCEPPYEVVSVTQLAGRVPYLYYEALPLAGEVYDAERLRLDRWPGGRFRYAGPSTSSIELAIEDSIRLYELKVRSPGAGLAHS